MQITSQNITAYINYLRSVGYTITLHGILTNDSFFDYCYHYNPYCHYIKSIYGHWNECICRQEAVFKRCELGSFFGICYAGVGEHIYPISSENSVTGFISVSGYKSKLSFEKAKHFAQKHSIDTKELLALADRHLSADIPDKTELDTVILPLVFMLESYIHTSCDSTTDDNHLYHNMVRYICENYHSKITMTELAERFNYSVSALSHLFSKKSGKSLPKYIDDLRLDEAKWHLASEKVPISEIAHFLGYTSSQYFSTAFKKKYNLTPQEYRKQECGK